jgi:hypothetical protein
VNGKMRLLIDSSQNGFRSRHSSLQPGTRLMVMKFRLPSGVAARKETAGTGQVSCQALGGVYMILQSRLRCLLLR